MFIKILGIDFVADGPELPSRILDAGLVVVPSGPGLSHDLLQNPAYREALRKADLVLPDSGLMALVWNVIHAFQPKWRLERYSGLRLLREILPRPEIQRRSVAYWIMPSSEERDRNLRWLRGNGFPDVAAEDCYVAPRYAASRRGEIVDERLLAILNQRRPAVVFINVGGGTQEQLGLYLRTHLAYRPAILCTGAAIAFLTGGQAAIPPWADRMCLGWLLRILENPVTFGRRYWKALRLIPLIMWYRGRSPVPMDVPSDISLAECPPVRHKHLVKAP